MIINPPRSAQRPVSRTKEIIPPYKGLSLSTPINQTPAGNCLRLENWIARTDGLHVRQGSALVANVGSAVTALMAYGDRLISCTQAQMFEGTTPQPGLNMSGGNWHSATLTNSAGMFLLAVNGGDGLRVFDGTSWHSVVLDGLDVSSIISVVVHQSRCWFVVRNSLTIWYLDIDQFSGTAYPIYLQPLCRKGGSVAALGVRSQDGGRNTNDQLIVVTTAGEMIVWAGSDPATAATWSAGGVFDVPRPVGRRCFIAYGGDLAYLSANGLLPVGAVITKPDPEKPLTALSEAIFPILNAQLASLYFGTDDWTLVESIENELLLINGPSGQFVLSATGAWSTFTGINATCWLSCGGQLYFGTADGNVCRYDGFEDQGAAIPSYLVDRYDRIGSIGTKTLCAVRPFYRGPHPYKPRVQALNNYRDPPATFAARYTDALHYQWEDVSWPMQPALWERATSSRQGLWRSITAHGTELALMVGMKTRSAMVYYGTDMQFETGGSL